MPEPIRIPSHLGRCEILKTHDDGDVTAKCGDTKYVMTTEGEVFEEVGVSYYGALVGEIFKKYLTKQITLIEFLKKAQDIEKIYQGEK